MKRIFAIFSILIISSLINLGGSGSSVEEIMVAPFTSSGVIDILNENDLEDQVDTEGWDGNGTSEDPYIIDDLQINMSGGTVGISIKYTSSHIVLSNLSFSGWGSPTWYLILLDSVSNITVKNCNFSNSPSPLDFMSSSNILVTDCSFRNHSYGVNALIQCWNLTVQRCSFSECGYGVIGSITLLTDCFFANNSEGAGLRYDGGTIQNCTFEDNNVAIGGRGENFKIIGNVITRSRSGINLQICTNTLVRDNIISSSDYAGISIVNCDNIVFYDNEITNGYFSFFGSPETYFNTIIPSNNTVDGKPVHQYRNAHMDNASAISGSGQLIVVNVSWFSIDNISI